MIKRLLILILLLSFSKELKSATREVIAVIDSRDMRGERKRSYVLNIVSDKFPQVARKDIGLLIELLMQVR